MLFYVSKPAQDGSLDEKLIVAHRTQPLIATAWTAPTSVLVTDNEGEVLACVNEPAGCTPETSKGCVVTSLAWHPTERILTIGWNSGRLSTWSMPCITELGVKEDVADSNANIYSTPALIALSAKAATIADAEGAMKEHGEGAVKCLEWTVNGQYLLSTSMKNTAVMWVLENSVGTSTAPTVAHKLKPLWSVTTEGGEPIKTATNIPEGQWKGRSANAAVKEDNMSFLLTNDSNSIFFVNEEQKFGTCVTLEDRLVTMVYDPAKRQLVTLTNSGMIEIFQLGEDLTAKSTLRRKLSTPSSDKYSFTMAQVLPGVVAFSSGDDRVRVFDIKTEDMYMLTFPKEGAHVTTVVADHTKGLLAVGTEEGALVVFSTHIDSHRPENAAAGLGADAKKHLNSEDRAKLWEPRPIHELGDVINNIILSPMGDLAACVGGKQLQVLHESVRKRAWDGVAAATQISTEMVVIESVTGCQCLLKSKSKVRGLSIAFPNIALWNGSQIDLYTINEATSEFTLINFVPTTSPAFAVHQDGLLYVKDGHIIYSTLQLKQIAQMSFTETEGVPILLDVMNDFVVAVSSRNFLRLARLSPRDLRPSGPSRPLQLEEALQSLNLPESQRTGGQIIVSAARVNAQGRRVALMTKTGVFGVQDTRIWVYDSDNDKVVSYDFSQREEVPEAIYWNTPEPNAKPMGELEYLLLACETRERNRPPAIDTKGGDSSPSGEVLDAKESHNLRREDLPEALPDMENFGDAQGDDRGSAAALGAQATRGHNLVTLFSTRNDLVVHNSVSLKSYQICLVGLTIPDFLLASVKINGDPNKAEDYVIEQKRLRDFDGLKSDKDAAVREALMKFGYYSTIGNMDEAYRCIKTIKNPTAWQGLAKMCVSNGRLDVAAVCLATMQDGVAARALREAIEEYPNDKRIQMASLACSLSMLEECEQLLHEAKREDLITDVFLACGKFEQAQRHSEHFDRIRIRPVAYKYAQFMESLQNMDAAIMWYYNAKCAGTDVPRIYYQSRRRAELRELIMPSNTAQSNGQESDEPPATSGDAPAGEDAHGTFAALFPHNKDLLLWWAQHSERHRNLQEALRFYHAGKDVYNVVRLLCTMTPPKIDNAIELVNTEIERAKSKFLQQQATCVSGDPSIPTEPDPVGAAFFIGKHYENINELERALEYYKHAAAFRSAIRVSRRLNRYGEILHLALSSGDSRLMLDNAIFLEKKGAFDKAVEIFRKLNATQCALDGCIKGSLFDTLHEISTTLAQASSDPQVFLSMANHFQSIGNYQKAVEMLVFAKKFEDALQMCQERNVILTEEMADTMTVETPETTAEDRNQWLRRIAHIAKDQGSWTLACKKYTQSGERLKALKMLMRGGDVTKVIFFANHSRNAEIFTLAANFLQSQNWSTDATIYSSIISFYTKAKAFDNLMAFYDSCAQLQIDENRNYTEALSAVEECIRAVEKALANKINVSTTKLSIFKDRSKLLGGFVKAQQLVRSMNPDRAGSPAEKQIADEVIAICSDIIKRSRAGNPDHDLIETSLRVGDVFALLVKFYFEKMKEPKNALKVLESMPKHGVEPQYFLEMDMMEKVCSANGKKLSEVVVIGKDGALGGGSPGADDQPERDTDLLDDELR